MVSVRYQYSTFILIFFYIVSLYCVTIIYHYTSLSTIPYHPFGFILEFLRNIINTAIYGTGTSSVPYGIYIFIFFKLRLYVRTYVRTNGYGLCGVAKLFPFAVPENNLNISTCRTSRMVG